MPTLRTLSRLITLPLCLLLICFAPTSVFAQLGSVPYTFSPGGVIRSSEVNAMFSAIYSTAVARSGGSLTGSLTTQALAPDGDNTRDLGSAALSYKDAWFDGTVTMATMAITTITCTGCVTSTNVLDGTLLNADINASAAIALSKLATTGDLGTAVTIGTAYIYRASGTDVPVADGGTGSSTAADARTALGLAIGTNVQAYDADLATWAGITPGTGVGTALAVAVGSAGAFITNGGALGTPSSGTLTNATGLPAASVVAGSFGAGNFGFTGAVTVTRAGIATTGTDGVVLTNTTAATAIATSQYSPRTHWTGQGWKTDVTAGSQAVDMIAELRPVQGAANPTSVWALASSVNGGAFSDVFTVSSAGNATVTTLNTYTFNQSVASGASPTFGAGNITGVLEANITDGSILARLAANETVTGSYTFSGGFASTASAAGTTAGTFTSNGVSGINHPLATFQRAGGAVASEIGYEGVGGTIHLWTTTAHTLILGTNSTANLTLASGGAATFNSTLAWGGGSAISSSSNVALLDALNTFTGFGTHSFSAGGAGANQLDLRNTTAGTGNYASMRVGNDTSAATAGLYAFSSTYTTSGPAVADSAMLQGQQVGGLSLSASHASGDVRLYSRNTLALTLGASQVATFTGTVNGVASNWSGLLSLTGTAANIALGSNYITNEGTDGYGIAISTAGAVTITVANPDALALSVSDWIYAPGLDTGTGTTVVLTAGNYLVATTSSERFKQNIRRDVSGGKGLQTSLQAFLSIEPILFDYKDQPGFDPKTGKSVRVAGTPNVIGFSAEEVFAAGLGGLVNLDETGSPLSLREHGFLAYQQLALRDHEKRIAALEAEIQRLRERR